MANMGATVILSGMPHYVTLKDLAYNLDKLFDRDTIGTFRVRDLHDQHKTRQIALDFLSYYDARTAQDILDGYKYELPSGKYTLKAKITDNPEYLPESPSPRRGRSRSLSQNRESENWKALAMLPTISDGELYRANSRLDAQLELLRKQTKLVRKERKLLKEKRKLDYDYKRTHSHSDLNGEGSTSRGTYKRNKRSRSQSRRSRSRHDPTNSSQTNPGSAERPQTKWPAIMPDASVSRLPYRSRSSSMRYSPRNRSRSPLRAEPSFSRNYEIATVDVGQRRSRTLWCDDRQSKSRATATATHYDNYCNNKLTSSDSSTQRVSEAIREATGHLLADKQCLLDTIDAKEKNKILEKDKKTILKQLEEIIVDRLEKISSNTRRSLSVRDIIIAYNESFTKASDELLVTRLCSKLNYLSFISIAKDSEVATVVDKYSEPDGNLKSETNNAEGPVEPENEVKPKTVTEDIAVDQKIEITEDASMPLLNGSDSTFWVVVDEVLDNIQLNTLKPGEIIEKTATNDNIEINENVTPSVNETGTLQKKNTRKKKAKKNRKHPKFNIIVQLINNQMAKHTTMLDPKIKEKVIGVASHRLRIRLKNMLKDKNQYLHPSQMLLLYRKLYPIEGDEKFVNETVDDIKNRKSRSILDNQELCNNTELVKENQTPNTIGCNPTIQAETTIEGPSDICKEKAVADAILILPKDNTVPGSETNYTFDDDVILVHKEVEVITISDSEGEYDARVEVAAIPVQKETQSEAVINPTVEAAKGTPDDMQTLHVVNTSNTKSCGYKPSAESMELVHIDVNEKIKFEEEESIPKVKAEIEINTSELDHSFPKNTVYKKTDARITSEDIIDAKDCNLMSVAGDSVAVPQSQNKNIANEHEKNNEIIEENASVKQVSLDLDHDKNTTQENCETDVSAKPVDSVLNTENVVKTEDNVTKDIKKESEAEESIESIKKFIALISEIIDLT